MGERIVVSIDLAHSSYTNNGVVVLTDTDEAIWADLVEIPLSGKPDAKQLAEYAAKLAESSGADLIFVDGPQGWRDPAEDVSELRVCERKLAAPAKTGLPLQVKPHNYTPFVRFSIEVFDALHDLGWKRLMDPAALATAEHTAVESFPLAAWRALKIPSLPAKAKASAHDIAERLGIIKSLGPLDLDGEPTHDQLQAIVAGLAGFPDRFDIQAAGVTPRMIDGTSREGFIVCPKRKPDAAEFDLQTPAKERLFTIRENRWYAWQMIPGYLDGGYFSPIYVGQFRALHTGKGLVEMSFFNAMYATGVQGFSIKARVIKRAPDFLVLDLGPNGQRERAAIVSEVSFGWLARTVSSIEIPEEAPSEIQTFLDNYFGVPAAD